MTKYFITIFFIIFSCIQIACANGLDTPQKLSVISKEIPHLNNISCKFYQEKTFPNSSVKIVSSGDFKFVKNKEVIFHTTYPTDFVTSYNTAQYKQIKDIINAISTKNYTKLEKEFVFYFYKKNLAWTLKLVPKKKSQSEKYISSIIIQGTDYITNLVINTVSSGNTVIRFKR